MPTPFAGAPVLNSSLTEDQRRVIAARRTFPASNWIDMSSSAASKIEFDVAEKNGSRNCYRVNKSEQHSLEWHASRVGCQTSSETAAAIDMSSFASPHTTALSCSGLLKKRFSAAAVARMDHGTKVEPIARREYERKRNTRVVELGLAVPLWETRIGTSTDGVNIGPHQEQYTGVTLEKVSKIEDQTEVKSTNWWEEAGLADSIRKARGIIEIKGPETMYPKLEAHAAAVFSGVVFPPFYHEHIDAKHYIQMQVCMRILDKDWCDYIVYATNSQQIYIERVPFYPDCWDGFIWPRLQTFLNVLLEPCMAQVGNQKM